MPEVLTQNLAVALRPRRFSEVVGYNRTIGFIKNQFASGRIPTAMLFVGVSRGGKTTLAKIIGASVNCTHQAEFGEPCDACIASAEEGSFEVFEMNAALVNKVEDARAQVGDLNLVPRMGDYRIIILDECQQMTKPAQNVWLKVLEQEKSFNIVIFCTTDPGDMIVPLQKRCASSRYSLDGLSAQEVKLLVWKTSQKVEIEGGWDNTQLGQLSALLWERSILAPGDIVSAVEALTVGKTPEEAAVSSDFSGKVNVYRLINAIHNGDWDTCREELAGAEARDGSELLVRLGANLRGKMLESTARDATARYSRWIDTLLERQTPVAGLILGGLVSTIWQFCQEVQGKAHAVPRAA